MNDDTTSTASSSTSVRVALILGVLWAAAIGAIWYADQEKVLNQTFLHFFARFHVLIVHVPIGLISVAFVMDVLSYFTAFGYLKRSIPFILWVSFIGAIGSTVAGCLLMFMEDFSGRALDLHLYTSLAIVVLTLFALIQSLRNRRILAGLGTAAALLMTAASGHFGGAMVHRDDYLTQYAPDQLKPILHFGLVSSKAPAQSESTETEMEKDLAKPIGDRLVYQDFVAPIMDRSCDECHNENKTKGKLRTDTYEMLIAGAKGSEYPNIVPGDAAESELIVRVELPEDDDEFMPEDADPLPKAEIELLKLWINAGAKEDMTIAQLGDDPKIIQLAEEVWALYSGGKAAGAAPLTHPVTQDSASAWEALPDEEKESRLKAVRAEADKLNFTISTVSDKDSRLQIDVVNAAKDFGDEQVKLLEPVAEQIVSLNLARSQVTDHGLKSVAMMTNLETLHLEATGITDAGVSELAPLKKLTYLNLYETKVGNGIFDTLAELPALRNVYVWKTEVNPERAKAYEQSVNLKIDTGEELMPPPPAPPSQSIQGGNAKGAEAPKPVAPAKTETPKPAKKLAEPVKAEAPKPVEKPASPAKVEAPKPAEKPAASEKADLPKPVEKANEAAKPEAPKPQKPAPVIEKKAA